MTHELNCPHSGCPLLLGIQNTSRVSELDIIEVLHREIAHLRATVARLRGARFHQLYQVHGPGPAAF